MHPKSVHRTGVLPALLLVVLAVVAAYLNSFSGPFIFDDTGSIDDNPSIRHLWPLSGPLSPPGGSQSVSGRPVLNLSLAINYAISGLSVGSYHVFNVVIHLLAALTLFGIMRRTFQQPLLNPRFGAAATPLAAAVSILWAVHPLQTESVTYVIQRAESLMGLFYLLTLYCFIRATEARGKLWPALAVVACLCGMATKEVMMTAPLMVLLYDRTFVAGTFVAALRRRWGLYLALAGTWTLLAWLIVTGGQGTGGSGTFKPTADWLSYALTQFWAVAHYLQLIIWPRPLVLDYGGTVLIGSVRALVLSALVVVALLAGTAIGLRRWPAIGFAGCWFFGILALTSSVIPLMDTIFEHRVYLSLAAVMALLVSAAHVWMGRFSRWIFVLVAIGLIAATVRRNEDYRTKLAIWGDTVAKRPGNARARCNLGNAYLEKERRGEAIAQYEEALAFQPGSYMAHNNLGLALLQMGKTNEAVAHCLRALEINPNYPEAHNIVGNVMARVGRTADAIAHYRAAVEGRPNYADAHHNLVNNLMLTGRTGEAIEHYERVLELKPDDPWVHNNIAWLLATSADASLRNGPRAVQLAERASALSPRTNASIFSTLAAAYAEAKRFDEATRACQKAIELADASGAHETADLWRKRLKLYQSGQSFHEER